MKDCKSKKNKIKNKKKEEIHVLEQSMYYIYAN